MEQYISKSALVAEIERRIADNKRDIERASHKNLEDYFEGYEDALVLFKEKFLDTLEVKEVEEPVSIWHDSNEEQPNFASTVATWSPKYKNGEIISRCIEVYSDRIWAYIDDLLKM